MTPFRSGQQDSRTPSKAEIYSKLAAGARAAKLRSSSGEAPASPASPTDVERRGASGSSFSDSAADGAVIDWDEPETPASGYTSAVATPTAPQTPIVYADAEGDVDKLEGLRTADRDSGSRMSLLELVQGLQETNVRLQEQFSVSRAAQARAVKELAAANLRVAAADGRNAGVAARAKVAAAAVHACKPPPEVVACSNARLG